MDRIKILQLGYLAATSRTRKCHTRHESTALAATLFGYRWDAIEEAGSSEAVVTLFQTATPDEYAAAEQGLGLPAGTIDWQGIATFISTVLPVIIQAVSSVKTT